MSGKRREPKRRVNDARNRAKSQMLDHGPFTPNKSLGKLRPAVKTKPRSPDATGKLTLQRHTFIEIGRLLDEAGGEEITCNIAGWRNRDQQGEYLTIELSPLFRPRPQQGSRESFLHFIGEDE
jgi:hypothetical protein